ncbi:VWA domain-containing protein [Anaeromyxobacter sp. SG66]|uniref:vWA domain-containing protein n=1 Tax=Anaeromyxobacter sp. SG66 TaxID=2925410 RepID=UPI001F5AF74B|nr:VWA domain-containing protein [Anaeromyxobacter sp. SG66]
MKTTARLTHEKIRFDESKDLHLLLELQAPAVDWQSRRPPVCVLPVVDVSGSMQGAKLAYAKQSVTKLVDHLAPGDFCGLVVFTTEVTVVAPPVEMTVARKAELKARIVELHAQAQTNLAGGMLTGLELVNDPRIPEALPRRVILFTDGLANTGPATAHGDVLRLLEANLGKATVSAFGYGEDADHELLRDLSTKGKGNYALVRNPEDALSAFARELGGLLSTYARDLELVVRPAPGASLTDVVSDVDSTPVDGGGVRIKLPDLLGEELRQIVLGVHLDRRDAPGAMRVVEVSGRYTLVAVDTLRSRAETFELAVDVRRVPAGEEQVEPTRDVDEAVAAAQLVRAQIQAEERAARGDYAGAQQVVGVFCQEAIARGHQVLADASEQVLHDIADSAAFARSTSTRASMRKGFTRASAGMVAPEVEALLERSGRRTKSSSQRAMEDAFGAPKPGDADTTRRATSSRPSLTRKRSRS